MSKKKKKDAGSDEDFTSELIDTDTAYQPQEVPGSGMAHVPAAPLGGQVLFASGVDEFR